MTAPRPIRLADDVRAELSAIVARQVHDPGLGFVTITRVRMSDDLQHARVYYTTLGEADARKRTARAFDRATPFLRRALGARLRLRRVPELQFTFDESIAGQARVEELLQRLRDERPSSPVPDDDEPER